MTTQHAPSTPLESVHSKWTVDTLAIHVAAVREGDLRLMEERDRRYLEIAIEREKALRIKELADSRALELAAEIQKYKDEKANELRDQLARERLGYAQKTDLKAATEKIEETLKPINEYISVMRGRSGGLNAGWGYLVGALGLVFGFGGFIAIIVSIIRNTN